jgi:hypothetical protein
MTNAEALYLVGAVACFAVFAVSMIWANGQSAAARRGR